MRVSVYVQTVDGNSLSTMIVTALRVSLYSITRCACCVEFYFNRLMLSHPKK